MKCKSVLVFLLLTMVVFAAPAADNSIGAGFMLGEPTGISAKMYISKNDALDAAASWSFKNDLLYLHVDYLRHYPGLFGRDLDPLTPYTGFGALVQLSDNPAFGARIPLGLSFFIPDTQLELFLEIGPALLLIPETDFDFTGGIGARYYF